MEEIWVTKNAELKEPLVQQPYLETWCTVRQPTPLLPKLL